MIRLIKGLTSLVLVTLLGTGTAYAVDLDSYIEWLIRQECKLQGVDAAFPLAVAEIESRKGDRRFRTGLIGGKYYAPFAIHKDYLLKWPDKRIDTLEGNIRCGVRALQGSSRRAVLKRYNKEFNEAYWWAVVAAENKYRENEQ